MFSNAHYMTGLHNFIRGIRAAKNKEEETKKVEKELAKIRKAFYKGKNTDGYTLRKYVCKLLFIYMIGYDLDFGYMEAVTLLSSNKFIEKQIGYIALEMLLGENHELIPLIINSLSDDLNNRNEYRQSLALHLIANIGGREMIESLAPTVQKMLYSGVSSGEIKKKAALVLLRFFRKDPDLLPYDTCSPRLIKLLDDNNLGVVNCVMALLLEIVSHDPKGYEDAVSRVISILTKVQNREYAKDYVYHSISFPWLQIKCLRYLKFVPPSSEPELKKLTILLGKIFQTADISKTTTANHKNALNMILFEAIDLVIHLGHDQQLIKQTALLLGRFIDVRETNIRYLGLEKMARLATQSEETHAMIAKHQSAVLKMLQESDISIRKVALNLLYGMCDKSSIESILSELLAYLAISDLQIREELVLKISMLAERFAVQKDWYVDVILQLIGTAGDFVNDEIWHSLVRVITNTEDVQEYAARIVFQKLGQEHWHENLVKVGGYVLGEFGHLIAEEPDMGILDQFHILHDKFWIVSLPTRALLLTTYAKFINIAPEYADEIQGAFRYNTDCVDLDVQQRALEYLYLTSNPEDELTQSVLEIIPFFPETFQRTGQKIMEQHSKDNININDEEEEEEEDIEKVSENLLDFSLDEGDKTTTSPMPGATKKTSLDDLLGLETSPPTATSEQPLAPSAAKSDLDDLFGFSLPVEAPYAPSAFPSPQDLWSVLCLTDNGILFEDGNLQIGLQSQYQNGIGRIGLSFLNKTQLPILSLSSVLTMIPSLKFQVQPLVSGQIPPGGQTKQMIQVGCLSEFSHPPQVQIAYNFTGKAHNFTIDLPIILTKFCSQVPFQAQQYFQQWKTLGDRNETQEIFKSKSDVVHPETVKTTMSNFGFAILPGVDPNPDNLVCSGQIMIAGQGIPVLLRLEVNVVAKIYRLTLRTSHPQIAVILKGLIISRVS